MRQWRRGRHAKLDDDCQRPAPIRNVRRGDDRHRQRLLRQILADYATVAAVMLMAVMLMIGAGMLRGIVMVMATVRMAMSMMVMFVPRLGRYFCVRATMVMQKRVTAANNHRDHGIAGGKQTGQALAERRHLHMAQG